MIIISFAVCCYVKVKAAWNPNTPILKSDATNSEMTTKNKEVVMCEFASITRIVF